MIIVTESYKNLPQWIKPYMNKEIISKLNGHGIDLYNAEYQDASDITVRDPRWKTGGILTILLPNISGKPDLYMWGYDHPESNPYIGNGKYASDMSKSWLINNAIEIGFIKKNKKPNKDRYRDPRRDYKNYYDNTGEYAGQTYHDHTGSYGYDPETMSPGEWLSKRGRDKSGYVIPNPAKLISKLYKFNIDNTAEVLDNYYKKISRIKNRIFNIDVRSIGSDNYNIYERCMREFANLSSSFLKLEKEINGILSKVGTDYWNDARDKYRMTDEEYFEQVIKFSSFYQSDLDDSIHSVLSYLKKLENL